MRPAAARALMGLAVLVMISSGGCPWAAAAGGKMYWTDLGIGKIQRVNLEGTGLHDLVTTGLRFPRGIAVDDRGGKIYWLDAGTLKVHRANLDGSEVEDLVTKGLPAPGGITVDVAGGKMYWTDSATDKIQRANLDGTGVEDLVSTYAAGPVKGGGLRYGIALTPGQ
jgi:sugar lactone lactonase YvrE